MSEPSTDEREALVKRVQAEANIADRPGQMGRLEGIAADVAILAARPAVDVEGIARVLAEHEWDGGETLNLGYYRTKATCICGITYWGGDHDEDPSLADALIAHQAAAVVAYLAGEGR